VVPFTAEPAAGNTSWKPWADDVHAIGANQLWEPVARYLPGTYVAGTTDIGQYVQAAANAIDAERRGTLLLPPGTHLWNSPVYLNDATHEMTYTIRGHGRGTLINLGAGLNNEFAIHLNENAAGTQGIAFPGNPYLVFGDLELQGQSATRSMIFTNQGNVTCQNIRADNIYRLVQTAGYCDMMTFRKIQMLQSNITGSIMYYNHGNGDGLVIEQCNGPNTNVWIADVANGNGITVTGAIVGSYIFSGCDGVEIISPHLDGGFAGAGMGQAWFLLQSSRVSFRNGWDHVSDVNPAVEISDTDVSRYSELLFDGYSFMFRPDAANKARAPHVEVTAAQDMTRIRFRRCSGRLMSQTGVDRPSIGPYMTATDPAIQAAFDAYPTAMLEDSDLVKTDMGWQFLAAPPMQGRSFSRIATTPAITGTTGTTSWPGNQAAGTYYYRIAVYTDKARGLHTAASAQASVVITAGQSARLASTIGVVPALVRVWRGTVSGTYDRYVDVTTSAQTTRLIDTGYGVGGYQWVTTAVPAIPTVNTTMDGQVTGRMVTFQGSGPPTEGTWATGDRVDNTTPSLGAGAGWMCAAGGTPGTWVRFGLGFYTASLAANYTVAASSVVLTDTPLTIPAVAPGTYQLQGLVIYASGTVADLQFGFTTPAGTTGNWAPLSPTLTVSSTSGAIVLTPLAITANAVAGGTGIATPLAATPSGQITVTTPGAVTLRVAQNTADPAIPTVYAGSFLTLTRIA
jgi:uncharacterized protein (DUF2062 family)